MALKTAKIKVRQSNGSYKTITTSYDDSDADVVKNIGNNTVSQNNIAPAPSVNNNRNSINNGFVSSLMNTQNDVFSKVMTFQNQQPSILEEDNSLEGYKDTGKKYGDYYYENYGLFKDTPIYVKNNKYYVNTNGSYQELGNLDKNGNVITGNVMTSKEAEKQKLEDAKKLGYKDNSFKVTSQEYDDIQSSFKKLKKEYKLSDKELQDFIDNGNLTTKHIRIQDKNSDKIRREAIESREKLASGKVKQYSDKGLRISDRIYMDTHEMSDNEKTKYINYITGKRQPEDENKSSFFKASDVWKDGYDFGDVTKTIVGTGLNPVYSTTKGISNFVEGTSDTISNVVGTGLEKVGSINNKKKDVTETKNGREYIGYRYGNKNYWYDKKSDRMYDENWNELESFNIDTFQKRYTNTNKVAEFGRQMKEQSVNDDTSEVMEVVGKPIKKASVFGDKSNAMFESLGQALPLMAAGNSAGGLLGEKAAVASTSALTFANTYGSAKTTAIRNGASESDAVKSAFIQAAAETISEQFFDSIPGAKSAGWGEKAVGKISSGVEKYFGTQTGKVVAKTLDISGEGFEEIISNMITAGGNDIFHAFDKNFNYGMEGQTGNIAKDMANAMLSQDSVDSFVCAIITSAILNGGSAKLNNAQMNNIVSTYAKENNISVNEARIKLDLDSNIEGEEKYSYSKKIPTVIKYEQTDNAKINNFRQSAVNEKMINSKKTQDFMNLVENVISDKNYNIIFDSTITNEKGTVVDGKISLNNSGEAEIKLNPQSDRAAEFLLTHEITHAIETKELRGLILDYANKNPQFKASLKDLQKTYGTTNVNDEVVADISGQILGNQEFINSLSAQNTPQSRNIIKNIYESIKRVLNNFTSKGRYRNFVQDLETKWRDAYRLATNETTKNNLQKIEKYSMQSKENNTQELDNSSFSLKEKQLEIIKKENPMLDDYHTGIRTIDDIKTPEEAFKTKIDEDEDYSYPDFTQEDGEKALESGKITVYSSKEIKQGTFVSPSKSMVQDYAGDGKIFEQTISINDVAWINSDEGQYAKVDNSKHSQKSSAWQEHLEKNYKATGTRTYFDEMTNTTKKAIAPISNEVKKISNEIKELKKEISERKIPIAKEYQKNTINSEEYKNYFDNLGIPKYYEDSIDDKSLKSLSRNMSKELDLNRHQTKELEEVIKNAISNEIINKQELFNNIKDRFSEKSIETKIDEIRDLKRSIANTKIRVSEEVKNSIADYYKLKQRNFRKVQLASNDGISIDSAYQELSDIYPEYFSDDILNDADKLLAIIDAANLDSVYNEKYILPDSEIQNVANYIYESLYEYRNSQKLKAANDEIKNLYKEEGARKTLRSNKEIPKDPTKESSYDVPERLTRKEVKKQLLDEMEITAEDLSVGDDIKALNFQLTDPIRVNEKVFGWKLGKKVNEATIEKTKHNEAERTRWLNKERDSIKELGIKPRSKESAAVQKYGEGKYVDEYGDVIPYGDINLINEFPNVKTQEKIKKAAKVLRNKYDSYLIQINNVLTSLGYDAIPQREDYMRHFQELTDVFSQTGIPFNLNDMQAEDLPTDINGLTEFNKPGKNWFASAQKRTGIKTTYDAITGIDGYLEGASNLIYHTADIQRYRALSGLIRDSFGKTKGFDNLDGLTDEQVAKRIKDIQSNKFSKYAAWLDEQANMLANKKGAIDRGVERFLGRRGYTFLNTIKKQVGSNMTGFNVRSAMTNFISSTIASSKTKKLAMVKGTISTVKNMFHKDGFINKSDFLTSRFGSDSLSAKFWQKASNAGQIFMNGSDYFTANQIVRSKYYECLQKGMTESEAIKYADDFGSRVMGDRSKGMMPEAFNSKTLGLFTQFQLETNNQWQYMVHDTKMDFQKNSAINGGLKAGATMLFQMGQLAAYSYFFNELFEQLTGSRAAFDPVDIIKKLFGLGDDDDDKSFEERMKSAGSELVDAIPFASLFGSGGRMPISDALKPFETSIDYVTGKKNSYGGDITLKDVGRDIRKTLPYYILPTGYSQIKKTTKGLSMFSKDKDVKGSYTESGNLRFPVANTTAKKIQAGLFGEYASKEARDYFDNSRKALKENQQQMYQTLNVPVDEYWSINKEINSLKTKLKGKSTNVRQDKIFNYIDDLDISNTKKSILKKSIYKSYKEDNSKMSKTNKKSILKRLGLDK